MSHLFSRSKASPWNSEALAKTAQTNFPRQKNRGCKRHTLIRGHNVNDSFEILFSNKTVLVELQKSFSENLGTVVIGLPCVHLPIGLYSTSITREIMSALLSWRDEDTTNLHCCFFIHIESDIVFRLTTEFVHDRVIKLRELFQIKIFKNWETHCDELSRDESSFCSFPSFDEVPFLSSTWKWHKRANSSSCSCQLLVAIPNCYRKEGWSDIKAVQLDSGLTHDIVYHRRRHNGSYIVGEFVLNDFRFLREIECFKRQAVFLSNSSGQGWAW